MQLSLTHKIHENFDTVELLFFPPSRLLMLIDNLTGITYLKNCTFTTNLIK